MSSCAYITDLSQLIWTDLGSPVDLSPASIQSKLVSNGYLGTFNNLSVNCYSGVSGTIDPSMGVDEQGLYRAMYERDYYTTKLNQVLAGYGTSWTTLQEGDSRISRSSTADVARVYRDMANQLGTWFTFQLTAYRQNRSLPQSVIFPTILNYPGAGYENSGPSSWPQNYYRS